MYKLYIELDKKPIEDFIPELYSIGFDENDYYIVETLRTPLLKNITKKNTKILPPIEKLDFLHFTDIVCYPDIEDPMQICLDSTNDMSILLWQDEIYEELQYENISATYTELYTPIIEQTNNIYNFKLDSDERDRLMNIIDELEIKGNLKITDVYYEKE